MAGGCQRGDAARGSAAVVDSIFPMETMMARFQATMPHAPEHFEHGASTRAELIDRFAQALRDSSVTALRALRLDAPEFAYLYFPHSPLAAEPYRQPPQLAWLLVEQNSLKGETRLLSRYGGTGREIDGYDCPAPTVYGATRVWDRCAVRMRGETRPLRLFGSIVEHDERFKFVSFANDL